MQGMGLLRREEEVHLCGILFWLFHKGWVPGFSFWGQSPNHFIPVHLWLLLLEHQFALGDLGHKNLV
jgi:hypothetical protein